MGFKPMHGQWDTLPAVATLLLLEGEITEFIDRHRRLRNGHGIRRMENRQANIRSHRVGINVCVEIRFRYWRRTTRLHLVLQDRPQDTHSNRSGIER
ncbi:MAG: hypothetical protein P8Y45_22770 [Exilibacterium sp.]